MSQKNLESGGKKKRNPKYARLYKNENDMIKLISQRTGVSQARVKKILRAFRNSFVRYLKTGMYKPFRILGVLSIYRNKNKRNIDQWRSEEKDLLFRK